MTTVEPSPGQEHPVHDRWPDEARALWQRICAHDFDAPGAELSFSRRLARDNQWSRRYAEAVLEEYRRFVFLAVVAGHPVTPSDQVDQAWHLHLLYTRDYWRRFCPEVLRRELHHGPTAGGSAEGARFCEQYSRTRHSYRAWFGQHAPAEIWPGAEVRFGRDTRWVRVNRDDVHVVPRLLPGWRRVAQRAGTLLRWPWRRRLAAWSLVLLLGGPIAAQDPRPDGLFAAGGNPYAMSASAFLQFFAVACVVGIWATVVIGRRRYESLAHGRGLEHMPADRFATALLLGGWERVVAVALAELVDQGCVRIAADRVIAEKCPPSDTHPLSRQLYDLMSDRPRSNELMDRARRALAPRMASLRTGLEAEGLRLPDGAVPVWPLVVGCLLPIVLALPRIAAALGTTRPIGYLVGLTILFVLVGILAHGGAWFWRRHTTQGGQSARDKLAAAWAATPAEERRPVDTTAIVGITALVGTPLADLTTFLRDSGRDGRSSGNSCGAGGCGGGGCGGGGCGG